MVDRDTAAALLDTYVRAWESQDADLILTIFTPDATYYERPLHDPFRGHEGIRDYWLQKVRREQANINCVIVGTWVDGDTIVAEWQAEFDDLAQATRKRMREVAILDTVNDADGNCRVASLREYWTSEELAPL
jgi:uncharacterized protein (TIGR02246 family)